MQTTRSVQLIIIKEARGKTKKKNKTKRNLFSGGASHVDSTRPWPASPFFMRCKACPNTVIRCNLRRIRCVELCCFASWDEKARQRHLKP